MDRIELRRYFDKYGEYSLEPSKGGYTTLEADISDISDDEFNAGLLKFVFQAKRDLNAWRTACRIANESLSDKERIAIENNINLNVHFSESCKPRIRYNRIIDLRNKFLKNK